MSSIYFYYCCLRERAYICIRDFFPSCTILCIIIIAEDQVSAGGGGTVLL